MTASFIDGGNGVPRENDQPAASHWQTKTIEYTERHCYLELG